MFSSASMLRIVGALVSAGIYAGPGLSAAPAATITETVIGDIRRARVDIYTSRDRRAAAEIKTAREQLRGHAADHAGALRSLEEAAWQVRQHNFREAEHALDDALRQLGEGRAVQAVARRG